MRLPPLLIFIVVIVGGYFVSVPLFDHTYGILPDGKTTFIVRQKDAEDCRARLIKSAEPVPPIALEPYELPAQETEAGEPICDFSPPKTVAWDWLHLPRALGSHSANGKQTSMPVDTIGGLLTSRSTWEIATGAALVGAFFVILNLLGLLMKTLSQRAHGFGSER